MNGTCSIYVSKNRAIHNLHFPGYIFPVPYLSSQKFFIVVTFLVVHVFSHIGKFSWNFCTIEIHCKSFQETAVFSTNNMLFYFEKSFSDSFSVKWHMLNLTLKCAIISFLLKLECHFALNCLSNWLILSNRFLRKVCQTPTRIIEIIRSWLNSPVACTFFYTNIQQKGIPSKLVEWQNRVPL